jgi:hypothetical protein
MKVFTFLEQYRYMKIYYLKKYKIVKENTQLINK